MGSTAESGHFDRFQDVLGEAIASRLEAIAIRFKAIASRLEAIAIRFLGGCSQLCGKDL